MGSSFTTGFNWEAGRQADRAARKEQLTDQQRQMRENLLLEGYQKGAITPQQVQRGIDDLYAHEPHESRIHRLSRFFSRKPAPSQGPSPTADFQGIVAGQKTPQTVNEEQLHQQEAERNFNFQSFQRAMANAHTPEEKRQVMAAFKVREEPENADTRKRADFAEFQKEHPEYKGTFEEWVASQSAAGRGTKAKPVYKIVKGHQVVIDPETQKIIKDFGPTGSVRVSKRQSLQYDNDGNPQIVTLTTLSGPGGQQIDVEDESEGAEEPKGGKGPAPRKGTEKNPGTRSDLNFRKATPQSNKAKQAVDAAQNSYLDVQKASQDPTPVGDQGVILAWLRGRVNRVTATEIAAVNNLGGARMKLEGNIVRIESGRMTDAQRQWFLRSAKDNYDNAKTVESKYESPAPKTGGDDGDLLKRLQEATGAATAR